MIWDESRRTVLHSAQRVHRFLASSGSSSDQRVLVLKRSAELLAYSGLFGKRVHDLERSTRTLSSIDDKIVVITDV